MKMKIQLIMLAVGTAASVVCANPITTLFSTGVASNDTNGAPAALTADGAVDAHYILTGAPAGAVTTGPYVTTQGTFPLNGPWMADSSTSKWLSPQAAYPNTGINDPAGTYTYSTRFDLTGFDETTVVINGKIAVDNRLVAIRLNGNSISFSPTNVAFDAFGTFAIPSGSESLLNAGTNIFEFVVNNGVGSSGNPTGLRVELGGTTADVIPEPTSLGMVAFVAVICTWIRRRTIR